MLKHTVFLKIATVYSTLHGWECESAVIKAAKDYPMDAVFGLSSVGV